MENSQSRKPHPSNERLVKLKKLVKEQRAQTPKEETVNSRLEKGHDVKKALEQYPLMANFENLSEEEKEKIFKENVIKAEVRKKISKALFEEDKNLSAKEQEEIKERQISRFYNFKLSKKDLRGHVEAPHGTKASKKVEKWSEEHKISDYETNTNEITGETTNWMIFKRPRLIADVNSLPAGMESSMRSEGVVYSKEDNLNAIKAQRDLTAKILKEQDNLDEDGKAKNPYLAVYLHGKVDTRGHDFEIAGKEENGKGPINPLLAFWIAEKLKEKVSGKGLKNHKGETPTVNVVTYKGAYSGSNALTQLRHGDGTFDFKGFGENFHALQLECGAHIRKKYPKELAGILDELMKDFSSEFKKSSDLEKLATKFLKPYEEKLQKEKDELFATKNIGFNDEIPENKIALNKPLREALGVEAGDTITIKGQPFEVMIIKATDMKAGFTMMMNKIHQGKLGEKLEIEMGDNTDKEKNLFNRKNLGFSSEIPEDKIALGKTLREVLKVEKGEKVKIGGHELEVVMMKKEDIDKGKTMMLNSKFESLIKDEYVQFEKIEAAVASAEEPAAPHHEPVNDNHKHEKEPVTFRSVVKQAGHFFWSVVDGLKSLFGRR